MSLPLVAQHRRKLLKVPLALQQLNSPNGSNYLPHFRPATCHLHSTHRTTFNQKLWPESMKDGIRQCEAMTNRMAESRDEGISPRTPGTFSTQSNAADRIERSLRADGHRIWGFVLYRCTYDNDADWKLCLQRINEATRKTMQSWNGVDLLGEECFKFTVIEDRTEFDRASTSTVRQHFRNLCVDALHKEQGTSEEIEKRRQETMHYVENLAVRYRFCLQIDETSLHSIVANEYGAWINLISDDRHLQKTMRQEKAKEDAENQEVRRLYNVQRDPQDPEGFDGDEGDFTDDELDEVYPAIEGCTDEDVGWMMVAYRNLMPGLYSHLREP